MADNAVVTSLYIAAAGMAVVFLAMGLIFISMQVLTAVAKDKAEGGTNHASLSRQAFPEHPGESPSGREAAPPSPEPAAAQGVSGEPDRAARARAAAVAVGLARSAASEAPWEEASNAVAPVDGDATPWGAFYRHHQLRRGGPGRTA